jgi:ELWxxDGT repeat protein
MAVLGSMLLFEADDGTNGSELWKSDGTTAGTVLLKDINVPIASSTPVSFTDSRGFQSAFFAANDGVNGVELWKSDGTAGGTMLVRDVNPGAASSSPGSLTVVQGVLYFSALSAANGRELWRSDGTPGGTTQVLDIMGGAGSSNPDQLIDVAGTLFFTANGGSGNELWRSDGTGGGTVQVLDLRPGPASGSPAFFLNVGGILYFSATNGTTSPANGAELWRSDGTAAGTWMVKDLNAGAADSLPAFLTLLGGGPFFCFTAFRVTAGRELWRSDGTAAGTMQVADIFPGDNSSSPRDLTEVNGTLFFTANDGVRGTELWKSDGTPGGTALVKDIFPGYALDFAEPDRLAALGDRLLFSHSDGVNGRELWTSDGTAAGTVMVVDLYAGNESGIPPSGFLRALPGAGRALFAATDGVNGVEVWRTDGTAGGTVRHTDLNPGAGNGNPGDPVLAGALLFFQGNDGVSGTEPYAMRTVACGVPVGSGCPGTGGVIPQISVLGTPAIGNPGYGVQVTRAWPSSIALLVIGLGQTEVPLGIGCSLYVVPLLVLSLPTDGAGVATLPIPLPPDPNLIGIQSFAQAAVADPGGVFAGYSITAGLKVVFGDG